MRSNEFRSTTEPGMRIIHEGDYEHTLIDIVNYLARVGDTLANISNYCVSIAGNQRLIADNQRNCADIIINLQHRVSEVLAEVRNE